jgi:hypothetical protein
MRLPDFFIVGAPKCGTTALLHYLRKHPSIFMPETVDEPSFFCKDLHCPAWTAIADLEAYAELFLDAGDGQRVGEKSVRYLYSRTAASEIKTMCPDADIIIMLRNPIDVVHSMHNQKVYQGDENIEDFAAALDAESDRKKGLRIPEKLRAPVNSLYYTEAATFAPQVKRYLGEFGKERIRIIIYDDFKKNVGVVYRDTLEFLGVDPSFRPEFKIVNPSKYVRSEALNDLIRDPPQFIKQLYYRVIPSPVLRHRIRSVLEKLNARFAPRPKMNPETRESLRAKFEPDIRELSEMIGRDLNHWVSSA